MYSSVNSFTGIMYVLTRINHLLSIQVKPCYFKPQWKSMQARLVVSGPTITQCRAKSLNVQKIRQLGTGPLRQIISTWEGQALLIPDHISFRLSGCCRSFGFHRSHILTISRTKTLLHAATKKSHGYFFSNQSDLSASTEGAAGSSSEPKIWPVRLEATIRPAPSQPVGPHRSPSAMKAKPAPSTGSML